MNYSGLDAEFREALERDTANGKLGKIAQIKASSKVDPSWLQLAEFASYYGWDAMNKARFDPNFSSEEFIELLKAARAVESMKRYNRITDLYMTMVASQPSKDNKAAKALTRTLKDLEKEWK
jgi:phage-related baseplate assembly protein